ncbi:hypothetical protein T439DRAFT_322973 [Meredithblackwellia eburnea MCA 4105]
MSDTTGLSSYLDGLPEFKSAKGQFLYSSLASRRTANPTGFASALSWWRTTLTNTAAKGLLGPDRLVLHADDNLLESFRRDKIGRPASLGTVLTDLFKSREFIPLESYLDSSEAANASWLSTLSRPLWWSLSQLRTTVLGSSEYGEGGEETEWKQSIGDWVIRDTVEKAGTNLIPKLTNLHADAISRLYTTEMFHLAVSKLCLPGQTLSELDCRVVARYLSSKKLCVMEGSVIKFAAPLSTKPPTAISEADHGILALRTSLTNVDRYITSIESRISDEQAQAVKYNAKKQSALVKSHLVNRKRLELLLSDRAASRDKLGEVLMGIEKAVGSEETIQALSLGTTTLRALIASPSLSLENIEATTSALSDALADVEDINQTVNAVGTLASSDEEDVENELKELVKAAEVEEKSKNELEKKEKEDKATAEREKKEREEMQVRERDQKRKELEARKADLEERIKEKKAQNELAEKEKSSRDFQPKVSQDADREAQLTDLRKAPSTTAKSEAEEEGSRDKIAA